MLANRGGWFFPVMPGTPLEDMSGYPLLGLTGHVDKGFDVIETERSPVAPFPGLIFERAGEGRREERSLPIRTTPVFHAPANYTTPLFVSETESAHRNWDVVFHEPSCSRLADSPSWPHHYR